MMVVGARTSNGKSIFAINIANDLAMQGKKVLFLSLEMPINKIIERLFCMNKKVSNIQLMQGIVNTSKSAMKAYTDYIAEVKKSKMILSDCIGRNWADVDKIFEDFKETPDLVVLDHLNEVRGSVSDKQAIDTHLEKMRTSAIRNNFALVVCSQVNRVAQGDGCKEPQLHHLKGSGGIEEKADQVILLHYPHHYGEGKDPNRYVVNLAKNRDGMTGYIDMNIFPEYSLVQDREKTSVSMEKFKKKDDEWE